MSADPSPIEPASDDAGTGQFGMRDGALRGPGGATGNGGAWLHCRDRLKLSRLSGNKSHLTGCHQAEPRGYTAHRCDPDTEASPQGQGLASSRRWMSNQYRARRSVLVSDSKVRLRSLAPASVRRRVFITLRSFGRPNPALSAAECVHICKSVRAWSDACQMHRPSTIRAKGSTAEAVTDRLHHGLRYQHAWFLRLVFETTD
jgi:hypothetical protein